MRIKSKPEDFIVKELLPEGFVKSKGKYKVYELTKINVTTLYCLNKIGKCGYAGLKDKRAVATQHLTSAKDLKVSDQHFKLRMIGYSDKQLSRGMIKGNHFRIKAYINEEERDLIKKNLKKVMSEGFINYYGKQRSKELINKSFGYYYEQGDYRNALLRYYINKSRSANKRLKKAYRDCFKHWGDNEYCYQRLKGLEKNITIRPLRFKDYEEAVNKIPAHERELMLAGYQSLLWNKEAGSSDEELVKLPAVKGLKSRGLRQRVIKTRVKAVFSDDSVTFEFTLPPGSYATTLLKALVRK